MFVSSVGAVHGPAITEELDGDIVLRCERFVVVINKERRGGSDFHLDDFWSSLQHCDQQPGQP